MSSDHKNTALLVMDVQAGIIGNVPDAEIFIKNVAAAIKHARENGIRVIYATVGFRKGTPEISPLNKSFASSRERFGKISEEDFTRIVEEVKPLDNEVTVRKRRISAFTGSDLEVVLRANHIDHLVLTGCSTSGVVLSTTREAADKDYSLTILSNACADADEEVHKLLTTKVFTRQADVMTVEEWVRS